MRYRRACRDLEMLDARMLRDLGIRREQIPLAVRGLAGRRLDD